MTATSPLFIDGSRGALFCVHHRPDTPGGQGVIMLSAFAEEMNKSRHMVSEAARAMAAHGVEVLILDPWGTGESAGDHGEATWSQWCEDVERAAAYLRDGGVRSLGLWGLRVGALLAADCVERCAASWLVLWQPVTGGNLFLQQFLRLRLAAGMASGEGGESLKDLKAALAAGRTLEIAGYGLNPDMAAALEDARLRVPPGVAVHWFELPAQASDPLPPARQRPMDSLREAGVRLEVEQRVCDPFWSTAEIAHCPALIEANTAAVGRLFAGPTDPADARRRKAEEGREWPMNFAGASGELVGMLHRGGEDDAPLGVVVVVGGPQYRVGSHRQFVLLARDLAGAGIPVMRFDYNGMGDSEGGSAHFEACGGDIRAAVDALVEGCPSLGGVVLWGLCDGASAAMMYAPSDPRVKGLVLLNPWVRTEEGLAKARLKHYYLRRLGDPEFWRKVLSGRLNPFTAFSSLVAIVRAARSGPESERKGGAGASIPARRDYFRGDGPLPGRMLAAMRDYTGEALWILSGDDLVAAEFQDLVKGSPDWEAVVGRGGTHTLAKANHTFSTAVWRKQVSDWTRQWVMKLNV